MANVNERETLLKVEHLSQHFGPVKAVDDVSFEVKKGEVFGLVGESGCGKTTTGRSIIKIYDITGGSIYFKGQRICAGTKTYKDEIKKCNAEIKELKKSDSANAAEKIAALQKQVEEATALEMPALQQNLPIVATLTTLGTLVGLLGTVMGMIKSFQALAQSGAPDSTELSTGISEALINTAFGIATGAFAVISYNFYTNKIDNLTYAIDEIGFSIVQTFAATH